MARAETRAHAVRPYPGDERAVRSGERFLDSARNDRVGDGGWRWKAKSDYS